MLKCRSKLGRRSIVFGELYRHKILTESKRVYLRIPIHLRERTRLGKAIQFSAVLVSFEMGTTDKTNLSHTRLMIFLGSWKMPSC